MDVKTTLLLELSEVFHRDALAESDAEEAMRLEAESAALERRAALAFKRACTDCGTTLDEDEALTCSSCERAERAELEAIARRP